jgi:hypothetical protein
MLIGVAPAGMGVGAGVGLLTVLEPLLQHHVASAIANNVPTVAFRIICSSPSSQGLLVDDVMTKTNAR